MFAEEPQFPVTKWIDNPKIKRPTPGKSANDKNIPLLEKRTYRSSYNYEIDDETWNEFLEYIEMCGFEYTDPYDVEIWKLEYK